MIYEKRKIADKFTEIVANQLHYFDRVDDIDFGKLKADAFEELISGSIERYRNEPMFYSKVNSLVANLMQSLEEITNE